MPKSNLTILDLMTDRELFAKTFKRGLLGGDSWKAWKAFLAALFCLPMDEAASDIYRRHTGRQDAPEKAFNEAYVVAGRRAGKSTISALVATYLAAFKDYGDKLAPGEVGTLMVIAADRRQARVIFNYVSAFFEIPLLSRLVLNRTKDSIQLSNHVVVEIHTCSFKATRGYTLIGVVADEVAFWHAEDSANPDVEVLNALRPGLATTGGLLLAISSPYSKKGALHAAFRDHYAKASNVLVWKASSREMNPSLSAAVVALAYARDSQAANAEFGGNFRDDVAGFLTLELVEAAMRHKRELAPLSNISYTAFCDPSGGASDSFTLAIAHSEGERILLDVLREVLPPFSPEKAVEDFCAVLKQYRCYEVTGDRYGGEFPRELFAKRGISYKVSDKDRSAIYTEFLPLLTAGRAELLENAKLKAQLVSLERRTGRGKDVIEHPPGGHDDAANSCAGACVLAGAGSYVLGEVEFIRQVSMGQHRDLFLPDPLAARNRPADPSAQPVSAETQKCSRCGGVSRPHSAASPDLFVCTSCGHGDLICREVTHGVNRGEFLAERAERNFVARGVFGRFSRR
jgi:hypothetical protein